MLSQKPTSEVVMTLTNDDEGSEVLYDQIATEIPGERAKGYTCYYERIWMVLLPKTFKERSARTQVKTKLLALGFTKEGDSLYKSPIGVGNSLKTMEDIVHLMMTYPDYKIRVFDLRGHISHEELLMPSGECLKSLFNK